MKKWYPLAAYFNELKDTGSPDSRPASADDPDKNAGNYAKRDDPGIKQVEAAAPILAGADKNLSPSELAELYNRQGDEKCNAFKQAHAPHLYHIANEYYQYAAKLTHTTPKVCE